MLDTTLAHKPDCEAKFGHILFATDFSPESLAALPYAVSLAEEDEAQVRYVVTEHGVAYLHGKSIRERAKALIEIAHPKFRDGLYEYCEQTKWLQRPRSGSDDSSIFTTVGGSQSDSYLGQKKCSIAQHNVANRSCTQTVDVACLLA